MKRYFVAALLLLPALPALADGNFARTLSTSDHPDLYVSDGSGSIRIFAGGNGHEIQIRAQVHANGNHGSDVQARIDQIVNHPPIAQSGDSVHIGESSDRDLYKDIAIEYQITVPSNVALNLRSGSGDVEVDHAGRFLAASSGSGSVRAHGLHGSAEFDTGSGDIELEEEPGSGANANVHARTASGSIRLHGLNGNIAARTASGDIEADGRIGGGELNTGSGSIRLHVSPDSRFSLAASTGSGTVRVHMPGAEQADEGRHAVRIPINGGGSALEAHTGSGDIEVTPHS